MEDHPRPGNCQGLPTIMDKIDGTNAVFSPPVQCCKLILAQVVEGTL